jgi:hypothetical protein
VLVRGAIAFLLPGKIGEQSIYVMIHPLGPDRLGGGDF